MLLCWLCCNRPVRVVRRGGAGAQAGSTATAANATRMLTRDGQAEALAVAKRRFEDEVAKNLRYMHFPK